MLRWRRRGLRNKIRITDRNELGFGNWDIGNGLRNRDRNGLDWDWDIGNGGV
jgi:hypothetical protein